LTFAAASAAAGEHLAVVGNLPYGITSQIFAPTGSQHASLDRAVLMVQREVADRINSPAPARATTACSPVTGADLRTLRRISSRCRRILLTSSRRAFDRLPLAVAPRFKELGWKKPVFYPSFRQSLRSKRKTLANNLRAAGFAPSAITTALAQAGIDPQAALKH